MDFHKSTALTTIIPILSQYCLSDDNLRWIFIKYCVDYYYTHFVPVLLKMLLEWQPEPFNRNGSGRFDAVKSDSTHHFLGNACTKSGPLRFYQVLLLLTDIVCWLTYEFSPSLWKIARCSVICYFPYLQQVGGFLRVIWFPLPINLTPSIILKYCWKWR